MTQPKFDFADIKRILTEADKPSEFFMQLRSQDNFSSAFPQLSALCGLEQNPRFHAEGDVWTHSMLVTDAAVQYRHKVQDGLIFMLSALCHDFGKALCTESINGVIHSYGHEKLGIRPAEAFISNFSLSEWQKSYILNMVLLHMKPNIIAAQHASVKSSNRLFDESVNPLELIYLAACDSIGQRPQGPYEENTRFLMERLEIYNNICKTGFIEEKELLSAGFTEECVITDSLIYARKLMLACVSRDSALKQCLSHAAVLQRKLEKTLH